jgi:hypothetical protein
MKDLQKTQKDPLIDDLQERLAGALFDMWLRDLKRVSDRI